MLRPMQRNFLRPLVLLVICVAMGACATEAEKKAKGPVSENSSIPWNDPGAVRGGGGQLGMMQQNQTRR